MFLSKLQGKILIKPGFIALVALFYSFIPTTDAAAKVIVVEKQSNLGSIKGIVRDEQGSPIRDAVVAIYRAGADKILKQVRSAADGSFLAKIIPGTYTVLAVAEGYNPTTIADVQVNRSIELNYGFKLERAGSGNTLPEKKSGRYSPTSRVRSAQLRRSIYQAQEGEIPVDETKINAEETIGLMTDEEEAAKRQAQTIVETYFASAEEGSYQGLNVARLQPINENTEILITGQTGTKNFAPNRIETTLKTRPNDFHQIRLTASATKVGTIKGTNKQLGQVSFQALDEWKMKNGVILVLGFDYSRFIGAGNDSSLSPRFGLQFDANAKTRFRTAYTTQNEEKTWSRALEMEDSAVFFREQNQAPAIAFEDTKPVMNKSRRLEFGIERVLDNSSSFEATAFFDTVNDRGVGLTNLPFEVLSAEEVSPFTVTQQGKTQGVRFVYSRRFGRLFNASAGYSFGRGQSLSPEAITNPSEVFENSLFQTFVGQVSTDLRTGTQIKTIFRFSPDATIFAIDPFQGRMAVYDPSLSVLITQPLPNWGLPIRAEAVIDARNILDTQTSINGDQGSLQLNSQRRTLRGGIMVRF